jgi:hypothetical protein
MEGLNFGNRLGFITNRQTERRFTLYIKRKRRQASKKVSSYENNTNKQSFELRYSTFQILTPAVELRAPWARSLPDLYETCILVLRILF